MGTREWEIEGNNSSGFSPLGPFQEGHIVHRAHINRSKLLYFLSCQPLLACTSFISDTMSRLKRKSSYVFTKIFDAEMIWKLKENPIFNVCDRMNVVTEEK